MAVPRCVDSIGTFKIVAHRPIRGIIRLVVLIAALLSFSSCMTSKELASEAADAQFNLANSLYRDGSFSAAAAAYLRAEELRPGDFSQGYNLIIALSRVGDHIAASKQILTMKERFPDQRDALERLHGWIQWNAGDLNGAYDRYLDLLKEAPLDLGLVYQVSRIAIDLELYNEVLSLLGVTLEQVAPDEKITLLLAEAHEGSGDPEGAFQWYMATLMEDSGLQQAYDRLRSLLMGYDRNEMLEAIRRLIAGFPRDPKVLAFAAEVSLVREMDEGLDILELALRAGYRDREVLVRILRSLKQDPLRAERVARLYQDAGITETIQGIVLLIP